VSPRPISFSISMANPYTMNLNAEFRPLMTASVDERRAAYSDPTWRARALDAWARQDRQRPRRETFEVSENPSHPENEGHLLVELASRAGREPFDHVLDLALEEPDLELRVRSTSANDDKDVVAKLLVEDHCTLGLSDAGAHVGQLCDASQATDLLANWVRDRGVMSLETAVRRLSGLQADIFNFTDRGYLRTGGYADVVVFDPDTVAPGPTRRVRDFPANSSRMTADRPIGIRHVFVNGTAIRKDEVAVDLGPEALPGHIIAPAKRA
jgi:N-acyl-D-aspartate/D-glutamate deacylase